MAVCERARKKPCRCADERVPAKPAWRFASVLARSLAGVPISACGGKLRVIASTRDGIPAALLCLRQNRTASIACAEEPALNRKILAHVRAREALDGVAARAPPEAWPQKSELF